VKKKTLKEIASIAHVSPATVSLVLNNKTGVGEEKRKAIRELLEANGYPTETSKTILFLKYRYHCKLVEENQGSVASIFEYIVQECKVHGYRVTMIACDHALEEALQELDMASFCGVIVLGTELQPEQYSLLDMIEAPYLVLDNNMKGHVCSTVGIDNEEGVRSALSLCNEAEIAYLKSSSWTANFQERSDALFSAAAEMGLSVKTLLLEPTLLGAYESIKRLMPFQLPRFACADNDIIALGAMKALLEAGYDIPGDCSVVGFDDVPFAAIHVPSLTTVRVPKSMIGIQAVDQILKCIADADYRYLKSRISGQLVIRESTRA